MDAEGCCGPESDGAPGAADEGEGAPGERGFVIADMMRENGDLRGPGVELDGAGALGEGDCIMPKLAEAETAMLALFMRDDAAGATHCVQIVDIDVLRTVERIVVTC